MFEQPHRGGYNEYSGSMFYNTPPPPKKKQKKKNKKTKQQPSNTL